MSGGGDHMAVLVCISGRVQGVWYRGWTVGQARELGLQGWVRNRTNGTVEALFAGTADRVRQMVEACRQGPAAARVKRIEECSAAVPAEEGFRQLPTA